MVLGMVRAPVREMTSGDSWPLLVPTSSPWEGGPYCLVTSRTYGMSWRNHAGQAPEDGRQVHICWQTRGSRAFPRFTPCTHKNISVPTSIWVESRVFQMNSTTSLGFVLYLHLTELRTVIWGTASHAMPSWPHNTLPIPFFYFVVHLKQVFKYLCPKNT